jgi:SUN domain-containing protein 1/2
VDFNWLLAPFVTSGIAIREYIFGAPHAKEQLKLALDDEEKFKIILQHIDTYIENAIGQKLSENNDAIVNDRLLMIISNNIKDALLNYEYQLSTKDIEAIVAKIKAQLSKDLDERDKLILGRISLGNEETVKKINTLTSENLDKSKAIKFDSVDDINLDSIIMKILQSDKLFITIDNRLRPLIERVDNHDDIILGLQADIDRLKQDVLQKFTSLTDTVNKQQENQKQFANDLVKYKSLNDEALKALIVAIEDKFASLPESHYSSIDASVRKNLLTILGFNAADAQTLDAESIRNWISSTFVAKNYLEERLQALDESSQKVFKLQLDKNAGLLMDEISKEIKEQIALALVAKSHETTQNINVSGSLSEDDIIRIVKNVLAIYDADKTGLVDYALESAGAEIVSTRCTENYRIKTAEISFLGIPLWYRSNTPRTVISPSVNVGECWAFEGFPGFLVIKLHSSIYVTGFTVEHIPQSLAPNNNIDSALNNFTVWVIYEN